MNRDHENKHLKTCREQMQWHTGLELHFRCPVFVLSNVTCNLSLARIIVCRHTIFFTGTQLQDQGDCIYTLIFMLRFIDSSQKEKNFSETATVKLTRSIVSYQHSCSMFHQFSENQVCYITSTFIYHLSSTMFPCSQRVYRNVVGTEGQKDGQRDEWSEGRKKSREGERLISSVIFMYHNNPYGKDCRNKCDVRSVRRPLIEEPLVTKIWRNM